MAESTLAVTLNEIRSEVCRYLGFGRFYSNASPVQRDDCDLIIRRGLRQFYAPPPLPQETKSHRWSFLTPSATLTMVSGTSAYALPDDFGGMIGDFTYTNETWPQSIKMVNMNVLRDAQAMGTSNRRPSMAAIQPRETASAGNPDIPTRWEAVFHSTPDAAYVVKYQYYVIQDATSGALDYVPGGALHGETILASCLAIAETYAESPNAKFREYFKERLVSSVLLDRQTTGSSFIGRNLDRSDAANGTQQRIIVTYNGTEY